MKTHLLEIGGWQGGITSMFMSKRTWTPEMMAEITDICSKVLDKHGFINKDADAEAYDKFCMWLNIYKNMGKRHITITKFLSFTCVVEGLHRGAQDDFDAHAMRLWNRIIRNSTRLATFDSNEKSEWYQDKILLMDEALKLIGITLPEKIEKDGVIYVRSTNGYIREDLKDERDVKRGLYTLSIPSNFVFECSLTEWGHIFKERNKYSAAHPELQLMVESVSKDLMACIPGLDREWFEEVKN